MDKPENAISKTEHRQANVEEFADTDLLNYIKIGVKGERLMCKDCGRLFLIDLNGDNAFIDTKTSDMPVVIRFREIIGICKSCISAGGNGITWLATNEAANDYISPLNNKLTERKLTDKMLESKAIRAIEKVKAKNIIGTERIFEFIKQTIFGQ